LPRPHPLPPGRIPWQTLVIPLPSRIFCDCPTSNQAPAAQDHGKPVPPPHWALTPWWFFSPSANLRAWVFGLGTDCGEAGFFYPPREGFCFLKRQIFLSSTRQNLAIGAFQWIPPVPRPVPPGKKLPREFPRPPKTMFPKPAKGPLRPRHSCVDRSPGFAPRIPEQNGPPRPAPPRGFSGGSPSPPPLHLLPPLENRGPPVWFPPTGRLSQRPPRPAMGIFQRGPPLFLRFLPRPRKLVFCFFPTTPVDRKVCRNLPVFSVAGGPLAGPPPPPPYPAAGAVLEQVCRPPPPPICRLE